MRTITCFGDQTSGTFLIILWISLTKITRSHGPITLGMFSTVLHPLLYSLSGNRHFARKEELMYESITALTSNAGHLGWQHMRSFTKWHLWYQHTIPLMHRDHLVGNLYFVPFFVFYTESVMFVPRFIPQSFFYTLSLMLSPRFKPECVFCFVLYFPSHAVSDIFFLYLFSS